jgi:large subunit ribosomal protein L9
MQVILLKDVDTLGHEGDVVKVADGYAHNFLLPKQLAEKSTAANLRALEQRRRAIERREGEKRDHAQTLVERLLSAGIVVKAAVGEGGRLHGQVTSNQIAEAIEAQTGVKIDRRNVEIHTPIRELGDFTVNARIYKDVRAEVALHVVSPEGQTAADLAGAAAEAEPVAVAAPEPVEAVVEPEAETEEPEAEAEAEAAE